MVNLMWCIDAIKIKMAMLLASIAIILNSLNSVAQTFSVRSNDIVSVFYGLTIQPFGYQTIGRIFDSIDGDIQIPMIIRNFDFYGEEIESKSIYFEDKIFIPPRDNNARLNDNTTIAAVIEQLANDEINYSTIIWMDNFGDTLFTKRFSSPYYIEGVDQTNFILPTCIICSPDGQYIYFVSQIFHSSSQNNFMIKKLTNQGEEVWTYLNPLNDDYQYCNAIQFYNDNLWYVVQGWGPNAYNKLVELDEANLEILQQIELIPQDNLLYYAEEMSLDETGVNVACISFEDESAFLPSVYKMDFNGNLLWAISPQGEAQTAQYNEHLVQSPDGGYVSCSVKYDEIPNPNDPNDPAANNTSEKIWLWKVDGEGVFQWQRFYEYLSFDSGYFYLENVAHDLKATPDGGYIMAGESTANCLEWPCLAGDPFTQQGWLLKVDGCGCLVPGCDEMCVVGINENEKHDHFKFGPNPVRQNLNVYIPKNTLNARSLSLELRDLQGKLIRSFHLKHDDTTYVIDAGSLPSGVYLLNLMEGNSLLQSERMVVE
jgi:hypothetical protein